MTQYIEWQVYYVIHCCNTGEHIFCSLYFVATQHGNLHRSLVTGRATCLIPGSTREHALASHNARRKRREDLEQKKSNEPEM